MKYLGLVYIRTLSTNSVQLLELASHCIYFESRDTEKAFNLSIKNARAKTQLQISFNLVGTPSTPQTFPPEMPRLFWPQESSLTHAP
jgi:hypothetical protein